MKIHTPLFVIGLLTFITPFVGLPNSITNLVIAVYGVATMIIVSTIGLNQLTEDNIENVNESTTEKTEETPEIQSE
jgi:hypothetical protein